MFKENKFVTVCLDESCKRKGNNKRYLRYQTNETSNTYIFCIENNFWYLNVTIWLSNERRQLTDNYYSDSK